MCVCGGGGGGGGEPLGAAGFCLTNETEAATALTHVPMFLVLGPGFCKQLQQCNSRQKQHANNLEDIYDGSQYQALVQSGLLGCMHSISLTFNKDGVVVFRSQSSKYSFWPIFLMINELPIKERYLYACTLLKIHYITVNACLHTFLIT